MHRTRNAAYGQPYRGFESPPLRQSGLGLPGGALGEVCAPEILQKHRDIAAEEGLQASPKASLAIVKARRNHRFLPSPQWHFGCIYLRNADGVGHSRPPGTSQADAARSIGLSESVFRREVLPQIRSVQVGRQRLIAVIELERWLYLNGHITNDQ